MTTMVCVTQTRQRDESATARRRGGGPRPLRLLLSLLVLAAGCGKRSGTGEITTGDLLNDLGSMEAEIRVAAAVRLGDRGDRAATDGLCHALKDIRSDVRAAAVAALGKLGDPAAVRPISALVLSGAEGEEQPRLAAEALGRIGDPAAVPVLSEALASSDRGLAHRAAFALGLIGGETAMEALATALRGESQFGRQAAAGALGRFPSDRSRALLHELLNDKTPGIRLSAAENLVGMADKASYPVIAGLLLDPDRTVRLGVRRLIPRLGDAAVGALSEVLALRGASVQRTAADGTRVDVPIRNAQNVALRALAKLEGVKVVRPLVLALALGGHGEARGRLMDMMQDPAYRDELRRIMRSGDLRDSPAGLSLLLTYFAERISDEDALLDRAKLLASYEIPDVDDSRAVAAEMQKRERSAVRFEAARLLCYLGDDRGQAELLKVFRAEVDEITKAWDAARKEAGAKYANASARVLREEQLRRAVRNRERRKARGRTVGPKPTLDDMPPAEKIRKARELETLRKTMKGVSHERATASLSALLGVADTMLADTLLPILEMGDSRVSPWGAIHRAVVVLVGKTRERKYMDVLLPLMKRNDAWFRSRVSWALGLLGDPRGFAPIAEFEATIGSHHQNTISIRRPVYLGMYGCDRKRAAEKMSEIMLEIPADRYGTLDMTLDVVSRYPEPGIVPGLVHWLDHDVKLTQEKVTGILLKVCDGHVDWLVRGLDVEAHTKRSALAGVIADEYGDSAVPALITAASDERPRIRQGAVWALASIGGEDAVAVMKTALGDGHTAVRSAAVWGAARLGDKSLTKSVLPLLGDSEATVRTMAAQQLGRLGHSSCVQPLVDALKDKDIHVRAYAALSLAELKAVEAVAPLEAMREEKHPDVRAAVDYALRVLRRLGRGES